MSGYWCTWCTLSRVQWEQDGHEPGDLWTLQKMEEVREAVNTGVVKDTAQNRKGCVEVLLFDAIPVDQYIPPVLHCQIGMGNAFLNSFF